MDQEHTLSRVTTPHQNTCGSCGAFERCIGRDTPNDARSAVANVSAHTKIVRKGDHIYRASDDFTSLYVVKAGCIKTYVHNESGDEQVMGFYLPGEIIGFDGMANDQHFANAMAIGTGAVCEVSRSRLYDIATREPVIHSAMLQWCGAELSRTQRLAQSMASRSAAARLGSFLADLADYFERQGYSGARFTLPMLRTDIGRHLGLAVETVSRVIHRLRSDGIVDINRQDVHIIDRARLTSLTDPGGAEGLDDAAAPFSATARPALSCAPAAHASRRQASIRATVNVHRHP
jgi:CRP/FNR family transcriptional regulator